MAKKYNIKDKNGLTVLSFKGQGNNSKLEYTIQTSPTSFFISFFLCPEVNKRLEKLINNPNSKRKPVAIQPNDVIRINFSHSNFVLLLVGNKSYTIHCTEVLKLAMELIPEDEQENFMRWYEKAT